MSKLFPVKNGILAQYVKHISYTEFISSGDDFILVVPDGMTELVLHLDGAYERKYKDDSSPRKIVNSHLIGLKTEACFVKPNVDMRSITVRFKPGAIKNFTQFPMTDLVNNSVDASFVFGNDVYKLEDKILRCTTCSEINALIEAYLFEKMISHSKIEKTRQRLNILFADPSNGCIDNIKSGSENYKSVEREFLSNIGISPKLFKRIIQFNYASYKITHSKSYESLTEIGYISGYYDQAHFINTFKKFSFLTPKEYAKLNEPMFRVNQDVINSQFKPGVVNK